jgi:hypothetical protein
MMKNNITIQLIKQLIDNEIYKFKILEDDIKKLSEEDLSLLNNAIIENNSIEYLQIDFISDILLGKKIDTVLYTGINHGDIIGVIDFINTNMKVKKLIIENRIFQTEDKYVYKRINLKTIEELSIDLNHALVSYRFDKMIKHLIVTKSSLKILKLPDKSKYLMYNYNGFIQIQTTTYLTFQQRQELEEFSRHDER